MIHAITSPPYDYHGWMGFYHLSALSSDLGKEPGPPHARGLPPVDKHHPLQASGSVGLKHLA
jgi:hypothetical protein